jgi:hypothetical protein
MISAGITGMIIPRPILSNTTVMKINTKAAFGGFFVAIITKLARKVLLLKSY